MYIVILADGTTYNVDASSSFQARSVVEYKLKNRLDHRQIQNVQEIKGVIADKNSQYYNSSSTCDGKELKCVTG